MNRRRARKAAEAAAAGNGAGVGEVGDPVIQYEVEEGA